MPIFKQTNALRELEVAAEGTQTKLNALKEVTFSQPMEPGYWTVRLTPEASAIVSDYVRERAGILKGMGFSERARYRSFLHGKLKEITIDYVHGVLAPGAKPSGTGLQDHIVGWVNASSKYTEQEKQMYRTHTKDSTLTYYAGVMGDTSLKQLLRGSR